MLRLRDPRLRGDSEFYLISNCPTDTKGLLPDVSVIKKLFSCTRYKHRFFKALGHKYCPRGHKLGVDYEISKEAVKGSF